MRTIFERLERVRAFARAGRNAEAVLLADAVVREAHDLQYRPVLAEALLQRGRLDLLHQPPRADGPLTEAFLTALGVGDDSRAAEALALRMYARGRSQGALSRGLEDYALVKELLGRLDAPPQHLRGLVANNAGAMFLAAGDLARAEARFADALALYRASLGEDHVEVGHTLSNLAILATDPDRREELLSRALQIFQSQLGPAHPDTLEAMFVAGTLIRDPRDAVDLIHDACTTLADFRPDDGPQRARCLLHLATHAREIGEHQLARDALHEARELIADIEPESAETLTYTALIRGYAALADGEHADAIAELHEARRQLPAREWWEREMHASLDVCLGLHLLAVGAASEARAVLDHSLAEFATVTDKTRDALIPRTIALANLTLAEALIADHEPRLAAAALDVAESWYRAAGDGFAWRLPQIDALRAALRHTAAAPSHPHAAAPAASPPAE
ncbi:MAG TPA: tetratricopeptide repeat protein [Nannocystis sp.]